MTDTPVAVICYNRPYQLEQVLDALKEQQVQSLWFFSDGPRDEQDARAVSLVREMIHTRVWKWTKLNFVGHAKNVGLTYAIPFAADYLLERFDTVAVLEDDCVPGPYWLDFVETCLERYAGDERVMGLSGYTRTLPDDVVDAYPYDTYFFPRMGSQGWATWKRAWQYHKERDLDIQHQKALDRGVDLAQGGPDVLRTIRKVLVNRPQCWTLTWLMEVYMRGGYYVYPTRTHIDNVGYGTGEHDTYHKGPPLVFAEGPPTRLPDPIHIDERVNQAALEMHK